MSARLSTIVIVEAETSIVWRGFASHVAQCMQLRAFLAVAEGRDDRTFPGETLRFSKV